MVAGAHAGVSTGVHAFRSWCWYTSGCMFRSGANAGARMCAKTALGLGAALDAHAGIE